MRFVAAACSPAEPVRVLTHCCAAPRPAGLLGLPQEDMHRRAKQESAATQAQWAAEFRRQFDEFDWTKALQ